MRGFLKACAWIGGILGVIAIILYAFIVDTWTFPTDDARLIAAVAPTLAPGDSLLVARRMGTSPGHLTRCPAPDGSGWVVGRVAAVYGDTITVTNQGMRIVGRVSEPSRTCDIPKFSVKNPANGEDTDLACSNIELGRGTRILYHRDLPHPDTTAVVESGMAFLLSDDRHFHYDSRDVGQIDPTTCQDIYLRLWSAEGWMDGPNRLTGLW